MNRYQQLDNVEFTFGVQAWEVMYCSLLNLHQGMRFLRLPQEYRNLFMGGND